MVYDLDGTLVSLAVDWDEVADAAAATLQDRGVDPPGDLWAMLERADETGHRAAVEAVVGEYERDGARRSQRLSAADLLPHEEPVGVCSVNSEAACRLALDRHDLDDHVARVVGRDSGPWQKPESEPLLATLDGLGVAPGRAVFVGDGERDAETARRAGVAFCYVSDWLRA